MEIIAKSNKETLKNHSNNVYSFSNFLVKEYFNENDKYNDIIKYSALLHDIGKSIKQFQNLLNGNNDENDKIKYLHNEIGWAFVSKYINLSHNIKDEVCNIIYWHHGITNKQNDYYANDILDKLSEDDINTLINESINILEDNTIIDYNNTNNKKAPKYLSSDVDDSINNDLILLRSCIIAADRFVSKYNENTNKLIELFKNEQNKKDTYEFIKSHFSDSERFLEQKEIVDQTDKTTIINAPAGFGKTIIGLLWSTKNNKKTIWVCPRNTVAHSVYNSIIQEMKEFNININIELFLSGKVIHKNNKTDDFKSDIIITNIDNFLKPTVDNSNGNLSFFINTVNVIFDEYHELVQDNPLFSLFLSLMNIRNNKTKSNTLLLSATYIKLNNLWDSLGSKTKILPNDNAHYNAAHNKKYLLKIHDKLNFDTVKNENSLVIFNSIKNAQLNKNLINDADIIHGNYEKNTKDIKFTELLNKYGKNNSEKIIKRNLVGTHIIQASLDISFKYLYDSILSPQTTLQRIGRCNRWGNYDDSEIHLFNQDNNSENRIKKSLYDESLTIKWFDYIKQYTDTYVNLNKIYEWYNDFSQINEKEINKYINIVKNKSKKTLDNIYPIKYFNTNDDIKNDIKTVGSNKLRSSGNELFYICKKASSEKYTDIFNKKILYNISDEFKEEGDTRELMIKTMELLKNDSRFEYSKLLNNSAKIKKITLDNLRYYAKKSNTPYIRFDVIYDEIYGVITKEDYNIIKNNK